MIVADNAAFPNPAIGARGMDIRTAIAAHVLGHLTALEVRRYLSHERLTALRESAEAAVLAADALIAALNKE